MKCEDIKKLLAAYLDKEVTDGESREIEAHLLTCEKCREELRSLDTTRQQLIQSLKVKSNEVKPSTKTWEQVRQRITPGMSFREQLGMMMKQPVRRIAIPVLLILLAFSVLCGTGIFPAWFGAQKASAPVITKALDPPRRNGGGASASWAYGFYNLTDLCTFSDVIAIGVIDRVVETSSLGSSGYLYETNWAFHVEKILKGKDAGELIVNQMGSPDQPGSDTNGDPLFLPGDRYLLFLIEGTPGIYHNCGPWGRYLIWNDMVYSMNYVLQDTWYQAPPELDFKGIKLDAVVGNIVALIDSVQISLTLSNVRIPADFMRYPAGTTLYIDATLFTGNYGQGKVSYKVDSSCPPESLNLSISPAEFSTNLRSEYKANLVIQTFPDLREGTYWIRVECDFENGKSVQRTITLYIDNR